MHARPGATIWRRAWYVDGRAAHSKNRAVLPLTARATRIALGIALLVLGASSPCARARSGAARDVRRPQPC